MTKDKKDPEGKEEQKQHDSAEKFFNDAEYSTVTVGREESNEVLGKKDFVKTLLSLLDSGDPADKDNALELLKKENGVDFLLKAVEATANTEKKAILLAACWESGLEFKGHHEFFMNYALHVNPLISLEAITVLDQNRGSIPKEALEGMIARLDEAIAKKHDNAALLDDLKLALFEQLKEG